MKNCLRRRRAPGAVMATPRSRLMLKLIQRLRK
jgi:hypothetical protein